MINTTKSRLSLLAFLTMAGGGVMLLVDHAVLGKRPVVLVIQALAILLMGWARITFGVRSLHATSSPTAGALITHGPYRFVRNPIYAAGIALFVAGLVDHFSWTHASAAAVIIAAAVARCLLEESELRERYPEYVAYAARTARLLPFII